GGLHLVREGYAQGKLVASVCHGGWVPISAGIIRGHKATGTRAIKDDITNAGGIWVDESAFRDGNIVWGRVVEDIPNFCRELVAAREERTYQRFFGGEDPPVRERKEPGRPQGSRHFKEDVLQVKRSRGRIVILSAAKDL